MDLPAESLPELSEQLIVMVRIILTGTRALAANPRDALTDASL